MKQTPASGTDISPGGKHKILIIDDELGPREAMRMILKDNYTVNSASSGTEGIDLFSKDNFDLVILDIKMPDMDGISVLKEIKKHNSDTEVVMVTAYASLDTAQSAMKHGALDYIIKPFDKDDVIKTVRRGLKKREEAKKSQSELKELVITNKQLEELIAERTRELSISEQRYRELFENANDGIIVFDKNRVIHNVNQRYCELHGYERDELIGRDIRMLNIIEGDMEEREKRLQRILNGEALVFETYHNRKDGRKILLEVSSRSIRIGSELFVQSFHRDITEKKRLQEQLMQAQKMESIGVLAGGVAHDFNSILAAILGHAEILHEFDNLEPDAKQRVKTIEKSARKAGLLVSKLLSFARKDKFEIQPVNLNDVIRDTAELLEKTLIKKKIELNMSLDESIPIINGDANQLQQVVMNLVLNSADAMPEGGAVTVSTATARLGDEPSSLSPLLPPGEYAILKVVDEGTGIPDEIREKIFDPFFTTKEPGKGTGLGLAMVYGIIQEHKGKIEFSGNERSPGTTAEVSLPAAVQ